MTLFIFKCLRCGDIVIRDDSMVPYCLRHPAPEYPQQMNQLGSLEIT